MWLFLLAVLVGIVVGKLRSGGLAHLALVRVRSLTLLILGTALAIGPGVLGFGGGFLQWSSFALLAMFGVRNLSLVGMPIFLLGLTLNFLPVAANGGMPVRQSALVGAGLATHESVDQLDLGSRRHLATPGDSLMPFADIIPVPSLNGVYSFGDFVMAMGLGNIVVAASRPRRRRGRRLEPSMDPSFVAAARAAAKAQAERRELPPAADPKTWDSAAAHAAERLLLSNPAAPPTEASGGEPSPSPVVEADDVADSPDSPTGESRRVA